MSDSYSEDSNSLKDSNMQPKSDYAHARKRKHNKKDISE